MQTYRQKLDEMRLKSLRIIERCLSDDQPQTTQFIHALYFLQMQSPESLNAVIPNQLGEAKDNETGAEVLIEEETNEQ